MKSVSRLGLFYPVNNSYKYAKRPHIAHSKSDVLLEKAQLLTYRRIQLKNFENCSCGSNEIAVPKAEKASELWLSLLQISALRNQ